MEDGDLVCTEKVVKEGDNIVKILDDIITAVMGVTGVKTDTQLVFVGDTIIDSSELFKGFAKLCAFASHGL